MKRAVLVGLLLAQSGWAQSLGGTVSPDVATRSDLSTLRAEIARAAAKADAAAAQACPAGSATPQAETVAASAGSMSTCLRSDARLPRITRAGMTSTTDAQGTWAITWSMPMPAAPVTLPIPVNSGAQPVVCNVATSTTSGATGRCWLARALPSTILTLAAIAAFDPNAAPAAGISVQVLAIPPTQ